MKEGWLNCDLNVSWKVWLTMNVERWTLKTDVRWMLKLDDGHPKFKSVYVLENDLKSNGHNSNFCDCFRKLEPNPKCNTLLPEVRRCTFWDGITESSSFLNVLRSMTPWV